MGTNQGELVSSKGAAPIMEQRKAVQCTTTYRGHTSTPRCKVAGSWVGGTRFDEELGGLLLLRLRMVTLIALLPSLLFLIRNLIETERPLPATYLHATLVV